MLDLTTEQIWIALAIGNSRYHWAWFLNTKLQASWDTTYLTPAAIDRLLSTGSCDNFLELLPTTLLKIIEKQQIALAQIAIYLSSVVPSQTAIWQQLPQVNQITLRDIPLLNLYSTLGIDRALTLLGAGAYYGYPVLVIDGGTALTITGVNRDRSLVGGAIIPGLKLQLQSLFVGTAALPEIGLPSQLPPRWGDDTNSAIASGVLHTISSGVRDFIGDWQRFYPDSHVIFTGGDGEILARYLRSILQIDLAERIIIDRQLIFHGFSEILT